MKKLLTIIPLVFLLCFTFGCQDKAAMAELEAMKVQAEVEEQNKALIKSYFEGVDSGNAEILREFYSPDTLYYNPSGSTQPMSGDEDIEMTIMYQKAFPDLSHNIEEIIAVKDKVIVRVIARGTHKGELEGLPPPGNTVNISGIYIFTIKNRKIVEVRQQSDALGFYQQLGMELKPKKVEKTLIRRSPR